jgi:hypothetical protein
MPAPVPNATATTVMPAALFSMFRQTRSYPVLRNDFANGESIREIEATNSRRSWEMSTRLAPTAMGTFRDFFDALGIRSDV